jgi:hypothetical protein
MVKKSKMNIQGVSKRVAVQAELVFRRALALCQTRENISLETVLGLPITSIPTALFHEVGGVMRKTQKSDLMHKLEENCDKILNLPKKFPTKVVYIRDGMPEFHKMQGKSFKDFDSLANVYMKSMFKILNEADTVIDVFDQYHQDSIKSQERVKRGDLGSRVKTYEVLGGSKVPMWSKFLMVSSNKEALARFIGEYISRHGPTHAALQSPDKHILLAGAKTDGSQCISVSCKGVSCVTELECFQEEADTRVIFHTVYADQHFVKLNIRGCIVIKTPDTDILVIAVHYFPQLTNTDELWLETGNVTSMFDHRRYIAVHQICRANSPVFCKMLPAVHAITGCDSTSSFFKVGKKSVLKIIMERGADHFQELVMFSKTGEEHDIEAARKLTASLYDPKGRYTSYHSSLNALRTKIATSKEVVLSQLPPSEASFKQHVKRAAWQTGIWLSSHIAKPDFGSAEGHGWHKDENHILTPVYFEGPTSSELLKGLVCSCAGKKMCKKTCGCTKGNLSCCELCPCRADGENCHNALTHVLQSDDPEEC